MDRFRETRVYTLTLQTAWKWCSTFSRWNNLRIARENGRTARGDKFRRIKFGASISNPPKLARHSGRESDGIFLRRQATHELEPELVLSKILEQYGDFSAGFTNEFATKNRDLVLEALSDSGTVAPLIMTANLHSRANPQSYMYVFSHPKAMQDYSGVSTFLFTRSTIRYSLENLSRAEDSQLYLERRITATFKQKPRP